jgi:hypothetical protein
VVSHGSPKPLCTPLHTIPVSGSAGCFSRVGSLWVWKRAAERHPNNISRTNPKRVFSAGALRVGTPRPRVCCGACTPITTTQPAGAKNKVGQAPMKEREAGCVGGVASTRCCVLGRSVSALSTPRAQEVLSSAAAPRDHTPPRDHAACRRVHPPVSVYPCSAAHEAARMMGGPGRAKVLGARCDHQRVGCWLSGNSLHLHHRHRCRHLASNGN